MTDFSRNNVAPDSRLSRIVTAKGAVFSKTWDCWMEPSFCCSCSRRGPDVPVGMTGFSYLCTPCFNVHGEALGAMVMPDQVFWQRVKEEQLERYGRELSEQELVAVVASDTSPLATLIKEGR